MKLTEEQRSIVHHRGDLKINAVAGSGKTSTLIELVRARPDDRFLYIVFNKTAADDAKRRFEKQGLGKVHVTTAHAYAKAAVAGNKSGYVLANYNSDAIKFASKIVEGGNKYQAASKALRLLDEYFNSPFRKFEEFVEEENVNTKNAYIILRAMFKKEMPITHGFYMKLYQVSNPQITGFSAILYDEFQDANAPMADVFLNQSCEKICVGDTHQSIYQWRGASNSLESVDFPELNLTTSFRFGEDIAKKATEILGMKKLIGGRGLQIKGAGVHTHAPKSYAVIGRTNAALIEYALDCIDSGSTNVFFEGGIDNYTFMEQGMLMDMHHMFNGDRSMIESPLISSFECKEELMVYAADNGETEISSFCNMFSKFGRKTLNTMDRLRLICNSTDRDDAEAIFTTTHRSKGLEYDTVSVLSDFIKLSDVEKYKEVTSLNLKPSEEKKMLGKFNRENINEEINLRYVACTRGLQKVYLL